MHAPRQSSTLSVQITKRVTAKLLESPTARRQLDPTVVRLEAEIRPADETRVAWLLVTYNGEECGWPLEAAEHYFDDCAISVFVNGQEIDSFKALKT